MSEEEEERQPSDYRVFVDNCDQYVGSAVAKFLAKRGYTVYGYGSSAPVPEVHLVESRKEGILQSELSVLFNGCEQKSQQKVNGKGQWTTQEDKLLLDAMASFKGHICWEELSKQIPGRTAKQCRERWLYYIGNDVRKGAWTAIEDSILREKYLEYGSKWKFFEAFLPGRKCYAIRNRMQLLNRRMTS